MRTPDLILAKEGVALVIDTIICSDNAELYDVNRQKVNYYNTSELQDLVKRETGCERVEFCSIALIGEERWLVKQARFYIELGSQLQMDS